MAAIIACSDYLLLTNGKDVGICHFRSPGDFRCLPVPSFRSVSRGDRVQACVPARQKGSPDDPERDGHTAENKRETGAVRKNGTENDQPNYIRAVAVSHTGSHVAVCDDRKYLHIVHVDAVGKCDLVSSRCTARRCTDVCFSPDDSLVLVADKSGDAYSFPTLGQGHGQGQVSKEEERESGSAEETFVRQKEVKDGHPLEGEEGGAPEEGDEDEEGSAGEGTLILGHLSMLLGVMLVDNGSKVVTCDRDEKIRISRFPDAFNIHAYCLGHTEFVIDLAYCDINKILLSASGDCTVRAWSLEGREICSGNVLEDLPNDIPVRTISPTAPADGSDEASQPHMQDNRHRPSIRQMSYFQQCSLLFVAVERSPSILVYRLELRPLQNSMVEGSLHHLTTLEGSDNTRASVPVNPTIGGRGSVEEATQETAEPGSVAGLCVQAYRLWVLRQQADKLSLAVYTICVEQDNEVKITPSSSESTESEIVKTVSQQNSFLRVQSAAEDLLPFLWKANFQEDFKLQCNLKRGSKVKETVEVDSKGELDKKKAKIGENGR